MSMKTERPLSVATKLTRCDADVPAGARKSLLDIVAQACDDNAHEKLLHKDKVLLVENLRSHQESQMKGKRLTTKLRVHDIAYMLRIITTEVYFIALIVVYLTDMAGS